ncbi:MAG: undecaprenyl/decaprenyl-phosphate alpha-N-acetylglucosaminyl 1-phosphate transferase [Phycisphaerales bacterium]|nr:undecaprenyl/decaprenyl-phosphate alpha-N-acetylglucosaminyl 1-phosphate transferase [Phycisphaerales bacterium]
MLFFAQTFAWPDWLLYFGQFKSYFVLFATATLVTAVATPVYILAAQRLGLVDYPGGRKRHKQATATMGGLVLFAVVFGGTLVAMQLDNLVGEKLQERRGSVYGLLFCTACMILLGFVDDRRAIRPKVKLMVQAVVAVAAVALGFRIQAVTLPGFDSIVLPEWASYALSLFWIIAITNAINLTDGLDGLAAGICFLASAVNAIVAIWLGNQYMTVMMVLLAGSLLGFLRYNFHPARVFLGDTGSLALGMYLALASMHSAQKAHTAVMILVPLFALGYPIFDMLLAIARRMLRGQPLFVSDRDHIHHRLMDRSRTPSRAALQIYVASVFVSLLCIAAAMSNYFVLGLGITGVTVLALFSARVLGYLEWGGWIARWSGREETKVLHAAVNLARLKIARSGDLRQLLAALAIAVREMGIRRIEFVQNDEAMTWDDPITHDVAEGFDESERAGPATVVEMSLNETAAVRFTLIGQTKLEDEHAHLLDELCRQLASRIENDVS